MTNGTNIEIRHFHLFCGLGAGARGFNAGQARVGSRVARFRCLGGVDSDPAAVRDFGRLAGVPGTAIDLFDREQFEDFHGCEPPDDWREATPQDLQAAAGGERPHIVFTSPPCKGFSGLLSQARSSEARYTALNRLTLRGVMLALEAWADDPPEFFLMENVPRIQTRGRALLDQIVGLLHHYGYATAETSHNCGELGGLAQSRKRFLLVARHCEKVPPFLYEPDKRPLRGVGEVLERLPLPGPEPVLPMHRLPSLHWKTWVRLAFVEAGSDWRSLNRLRVNDGVLADFGLAPYEPNQRGVLGVRKWDQPSWTVTSRGFPTNGPFAVADPRAAHLGDYHAYGVNEWDKPSSTITSQRAPGQGRFSVADPRTGYGENSHRNKLAMVPWDSRAGTITGANRVGSGALSVADPRPASFKDGRDHYRTGGHYGVVPWAAPSGAVTGSGQHDNGPWSVADPRSLPAANARLVTIIRSLDGTWHRPFTALELAALQGLVDPEETLELDGASDTAWRERIGNAVPPPAATAIAGVMGTTLLLAWSGVTFMLSAAPIWVRPVAVASAVEASHANAS